MFRIVDVLVESSAAHSVNIKDAEYYCFKAGGGRSDYHVGIASHIRLFQLIGQGSAYCKFP